MRNRGDPCNCGAVEELIADGELWTKEDIKTELESLIRGCREEIQDVYMAWQDEPDIVQKEKEDMEIYLTALFDVGEKMGINLIKEDQ